MDETERLTRTIARLKRENRRLQDSSLIYLDIAALYHAGNWALANSALTAMHDDTRLTRRSELAELAKRSIFERVDDWLSTPHNSGMDEHYPSVDRVEKLAGQLSDDEFIRLISIRLTRRQNVA